MNPNNIIYAKSDSPQILAAYQKAQDTFKYFWRELWWERRRIVKALDVACVKVVFSQAVENSNEPLMRENMWINDIDFDGIHVRGVLMNKPDKLTNIAKGDFVEIPLCEVRDWLFSIHRKTYGGFTVQELRSKMNESEKESHDKAWGLNFGDCNRILLAYKQEEHPKNLTEHPMCINMKEKYQEFIRSYPNELTYRDEQNYTLLHRETIAGNKTNVEILLQAGADANARTDRGYTALDFARELQWEHLIPVLGSKLRPGRYSKFCLN